MMGHIRLKPLKFWPKHMTHPPAPQTIWTLTNGMAGFEVQTSAIAQTLAARLSSSADLAHNPICISRKIINPPLPYRWLAPYGPAHQPQTAPHPIRIFWSLRGARPFLWRATSNAPAKALALRLFCKIRAAQLRVLTLFGPPRMMG